MGGEKMKRDFTKWLSTFRDSIATYSYYVDFQKVYGNVENIKIELNILNSLIGSKNIQSDFEAILQKYPETLKCIPILLAVRNSEIAVSDETGSRMYDFATQTRTIQEYSIFMEKSGLFDLLQNHVIGNLLDYVTGVETGLDSNGRKNRGGHLMEDLVETYIQKAGFAKDKNYFKEMYIHEITEKWGIDLSAISNQGKIINEFQQKYDIEKDKCIEELLNLHKNLMNITYGYKNAFNILNPNYLHKNKNNWISWYYPLF